MGEVLAPARCCRQVEGGLVSKDCKGFVVLIRLFLVLPPRQGMNLGRAVPLPPPPCPFHPPTISNRDVVLAIPRLSLSERWRFVSA